MLEKSDKEKLENYIDKIIKDIKSITKRNIHNGMTDKEIINSVINITINKFTPESKSILSSTYNMLKEQTLAEEKYSSSKNEAAFYEMNISKELNNKFNFDVPNKIDYKESKETINKWIKAGVVVVTGGVISIKLKSLIPIGIATIIAGIMLILIKDKQISSGNIEMIVDEYLSNVKKSMMAWIISIEKYYDEKMEELNKKIEELERELVE